jgi:hypothetical protein
MVDWNKRIYVGVTCTSVFRKKNHWQEQIKEIIKYKITKIALFPTTLNFQQRKKLYSILEKSSVKEIKLVHLREEDFTKKEIEYLIKRFKCKLFNCHESGLDKLYKKFPFFRKNILLEPNYDNIIENKRQPYELGGFCIDFAHFKCAKEMHTIEYDYVLKHFKNTKFKANHLNGYSKSKKRDLHFITNVNQLNYLQNLPKKVFSKVIGLEMENTIKKQVEFKKHITKILTHKFS